MSGSRRSFDREFKLEGVRMVVEQKRPVTEVARNLGVSASLVHRWKAQLLESGEVAFPGNGNRKPVGHRLGAYGLGVRGPPAQGTSHRQGPDCNRLPKGAITPGWLRNELRRLKEVEEGLQLMLLQRAMRN